MTSHPTENNDTLINIDGRVHAQDTALSLIKQAKRHIYFFGAYIDPVLFDNSNTVDAISAFIRNNKRCQVKILIHSSQSNRANGSVFLPLAQKLTSGIKIHNTAQQHQQVTGAFMIVDQHAYLQLPTHYRYIGNASEHDPIHVKKLIHDFNAMWDQSVTDINIREMVL